MVATFSPENGQLLQEVHFIFLSMSADFKFLVPVKLLHFGQGLKGFSVLFFLSLGVNSILVPLNDLLRCLICLKDMKVNSVVNVAVLFPPIELIFEGFVVILPAVLWEDFIVELCPGPNVELGSGRKDSKSFADISDGPSLQVAFVDSVSCLRRKPAERHFGSVGEITSCILPTDKFLNIIIDGLKLSHSTFEVGFVNILLLLGIVLLFIHSLLDDFTIVCDGHFLVGMYKILLHLCSNGILFFVVVWKLIDEVVKVFVIFLLVESL